MRSEEKREPQTGHGWTRMECAGRLPVARDRSVMSCMLVLLLGGKPIPPYIQVSCARGGRGRKRGEGMGRVYREKIKRFLRIAQRYKCWEVGVDLRSNRYASFLAICSSRISLTVSAMMTLPDLRK